MQTNDHNFLAKLLILSTVNRKEVVSSSYFFIQLFPVIGVIVSPNKLISELADERLLSHGGYFDGTSGLIKDIVLTEYGQEFLKDYSVRSYAPQYMEVFGQSDLLKTILGV